MPVQEGTEGAGLTPQPTATTPSIGGLPRRPVDPNFVGPVITQPGQPPIMPGLRGQARFQAEIDRQRGNIPDGLWSTQFNAWVLSLKEDPSDPEYNMLLRWAQGNARRHEQGLAEEARQKDLPLGSYARRGAEVVPSETGGFSLPEGILERLRAAQPQPKPGEPAFMGPTAVPAYAAVPGDVEDRALKAAQRAAAARTPRTITDVFQGTPATATELAGGVTFDDIGRPVFGDPDLIPFMEVNGKTLTGPMADYAKRSGAFVYAGIKRLTAGENADVWMYIPDAERGMATMLGSQRIAEYQQKLGLPVSGYPDTKLRSMWNFAVSEAANMAASGIKVTVQEIFDAMINAQVTAQGGRGGGGGGGGGAGQDLEAWDYYRAMMAVLGDISGVSGVG